MTLEPVTPRRRAFSRPLLSGLRAIPLDAFLEPMPEEELRDWEEGHAGDPLASEALR